MRAPCWGCQDREPGCHGRCEKYREYAEKNREARKRRLENAEAVNSVIQSQKRMARRVKQKKR